MTFRALLAITVLCAEYVDAQPLVLPEYPADLAEIALRSETSEGALFRLFLAEAVYVSAAARDDTSFVSSAGRALQETVVRYPDLIGWVNGGLSDAVVSAGIDGLIGCVEPAQAKLDSLVCNQMVAAGISHVTGTMGVSLDQLALSQDLCASPDARRLVLAVVDRVRHPVAQGYSQPQVCPQQLHVSEFGSSERDEVDAYQSVIPTVHLPQKRASAATDVRQHATACAARLNDAGSPWSTSFVC